MKKRFWVCYYMAAFGSMFISISSRQIKTDWWGWVTLIVGLTLMVWAAWQIPNDREVIEITLEEFNNHKNEIADYAVKDLGYSEDDVCDIRSSEVPTEPRCHP